MSGTDRLHAPRRRPRVRAAPRRDVPRRVLVHSRDDSRPVGHRRQLAQHARISVLLFASHIFRMTLFFFVAGFFARMMFQRKGARGFWLDRAKRILVPLVAGWVILVPTICSRCGCGA